MKPDAITWKGVTYSVAPLTYDLMCNLADLGDLETMENRGAAMRAMITRLVPILLPDAPKGLAEEVIFSTDIRAAFKFRDELTFFSAKRATDAAALSASANASSRKAGRTAATEAPNATSDSPQD